MREGLGNATGPLTQPVRGSTLTLDRHTAGAGALREAAGRRPPLGQEGCAHSLTSMASER